MLMYNDVTKHVHSEMTRSRDGVVCVC